MKAIKFDRRASLKADGMEINAYIAGVNSGCYKMPYIVSVRVWARKWIFKKFFYREMKLSMWEVRQLRDELDDVIKWYDSLDGH